MRSLLASLLVVLSACTLQDIAPDTPAEAANKVSTEFLGLRTAKYVPDSAAAPMRAEAGIAYWGVANAQQTFDRLVALGAVAVEPIEDVGGGVKIGAVRDPFGNLFGVVENPEFRYVPPRGDGPGR
jgi:hypothetical protein